jgi:hypothetical protein
MSASWQHLGEGVEEWLGVEEEELLRQIAAQSRTSVRAVVAAMGA